MTQNNNNSELKQPLNQSIKMADQQIIREQFKQQIAQEQHQSQIGNVQVSNKRLKQAEQMEELNNQSQESQGQEQKNMFQNPQANQQNSLEISSKLQNVKNFNNNSNNNSNQLLNLQLKIPSCNCRKSKCLKMYCDCFAKGNNCKDTCKCTGCQNTKNFVKDKKSEGKNEQEIEKSEDSNKKSVKLKQRSCNCKKSSCLKKYCQCYNAGQPCSDNCKCQQCKNNGENLQLRYEKGNSGVNAISQNFNQSSNNYPLISFNGNDNRPNFQNSILVPHQSSIVQEKIALQFNKTKQKIDQDQIQTKISQILKLVPQQNYQTMLDFLAYCLS